MTRCLFAVMVGIHAVDAVPASRWPGCRRTGEPAEGGRSYLMPPAKPWMKRFWAKR
jgi:hypothetical protein